MQEFTLQINYSRFDLDIIDLYFVFSHCANEIVFQVEHYGTFKITNNRLNLFFEHVMYHFATYRAIKYISYDQTRP